MDKRDEELAQQLMEQDAELQKLYEEHQDLERQLAEFHRKLHLSAAQDIEKKRIQKLKLSGKDRIMAILSKHRSSTNGADAS